MDTDDFKPTNSDGTPDVGPKIRLTYTNWRGQSAVRTVSPVGLWFGETSYHLGDGWLLHCYDWDKEGWRDYSLKDCNFAEVT